MKKIVKAKSPTVVIVFGATGDLMSKKIVPAFFNLYKNNKLPKRFQIIGLSRQKLTDTSFRKHVSTILKKRKVLKQTKSFLELFSYQQGEFQSKNTFTQLKQELEEIDKKWGQCTNKLFYLAVPPFLYKNIFNNLASSGLTKPCSDKEGWSRVLVEKPFGDDLKTAKELDDLLAKLFREEQIFRIDHYLGKEMLQNILAFRFSNNIFEQSFNNQFIESIELDLLETKGVEQRGSFYDSIGTLKDVGQNHLLQMLALATMDQPLSFSAKDIRQKRAQVLHKLKPMSVAEIKRNTFRAQYEGYTKIKDVKKKSKTETYFKIKFYLDSGRWQGVPITIQSGKRLKGADKKVVLNIKHSMPCLCPRGVEHYTNKIVLSMEPKEEIRVEFWVKKPGLEWTIQKQQLGYVYRKTKMESQYTQEYEKLLFDCIVGDQTLFVSTDEVKEMWKFTDPIVRAWQSNAVPLNKYTPDTNQVLNKAKLLFSTKAVTPKMMPKQIGIVGLGKMGGNLAESLLEKGWEVSGFNRNKQATDNLKNKGLTATYSLAKLVESLKPPRVIWLMVPAGAPVDQTVSNLFKLLNKGDIIIDGGNSFYKNTITRSKKSIKKGIKYVDCGVSGGPEGARHGACLMVGGKKADYNYLLPLFTDLATYQGVQFFEGSGAGHFVKMVHNGIEYGMMQSIAEGFAIMKKSNYRLHLTKVADVYNHGSVIESNLIGWMREAFELFGPDLKGVSGSAQASGEGKWTTQIAHSLGVSDKVIHDALRARKKSRKKPNYQGKIISALRNQFGGHSTGGPVAK